MRTVRSIFRWTGTAVLVGMVLGAAPWAAAEPTTPERAMELFRATSAELDLGGDLYVYFGAENCLANLMAKIGEIVDLIAQHEPDAKAAQEAVRRINAFLMAEGLNDITGGGLSSKPLGEGQYVLKSFLSRQPKTPTPRFWRMLGGEPRELAVLGTIPGDAAVFSAIDFRPDDCWAFIQQTIRSVGGEEAYTTMRKKLDEWKREGGVDVDALVSSLSGELAVSVVLGRDKTVQLPIGEKGVEIPPPSLIVALGVKDGSLLATVLDQAKKNAWPMEETTIEGVPAYLLGEEMPEVPVPLRFIAAQADGFFFFASHPDAVAGAISAARRGDGIKKDPVYARLMGQLPRENNGVSFTDERFNRTIASIQLAQMRQQDPSGLVAEIMERIFGWLPVGSSASVRVLKPNGIQAQTIGPTGGKEIAMTIAAMPVGLLAGVAVPSFVRARSHAEMARSHAEELTLLNTLRIVDSAKEQWAMEHNKSDGAEVTEADIAVYLKGGIPTLPPGHALQINPIGKSPVIVKPDGTEITLP